jgi:enoyl-CoA hydratase/carnithine racemase
MSCFFRESLSAKEAHRMGIVDQIVLADQVKDAAINAAYLEMKNRGLMRLIESRFWKND